MTILVLSIYYIFGVIGAYLAGGALTTQWHPTRAGALVILFAGVLGPLCWICAFVWFILSLQDTDRGGKWRRWWSEPL